MKYIIKGGKKLSGEVTLSGNKNSVLPCMAAALLTKEEVVLENVPEITDVDVFVEIFEKLGVEVFRDKDRLSICARKIDNMVLPDNLVKKLRASVLLAGPIAVREKKVSFGFPGGDLIGKRSIDVHLQGFKALGASISIDNSLYTILFNQKKPGKKIRIFLEEASVTATENLILASVVGEYEVTIRNVAMEPHVVDLCNLLSKMGAKIAGTGTNLLIISGVNKISGTTFRVSDDHIHFGTYAIAAATTKSKLKILTKKETDLEPIIFFLSKFGVNFKWEEGGYLVSAGKLLSVEKVVTNIWPGFPTDLMSLVIVLATQVKGMTLCHDWMFESRMLFVEKLIKMGANINISDANRVFVTGPSQFTGKELESSDIRSGMALVLAALIAKDVSTINKAELIERGYEDVVGKLSKLGANIRKA